MCFKNGNGEGSSDSAPRPSQGGAYHSRSSVGRQHVGQNQRDGHEEQYDTPKVEIDLAQRERAHSQSLVVVHSPGYHRAKQWSSYHFLAPI